MWKSTADSDAIHNSLSEACSDFHLPTHVSRAWQMRYPATVHLPPAHDALLLSISGTGCFICPVAQTRLDIPRPLITQSHRYGWTYQGLWLPSHTDTAGHTKVFIYPVTQTRLDIPRPLITQSHRHGWTYQGLYLRQAFVDHWRKVFPHKADWLSDWLSDWLTVCLSDCLSVWLTDWLTHPLPSYTSMFVYLYVCNTLFL